MVVLKGCVIFELLKLMIVKIIVLRDVTSCSLVEVYGGSERLAEKMFTLGTNELCII
jgi:hypothetical protein